MTATPSPHKLLLHTHSYGDGGDDIRAKLFGVSVCFTFERRDFLYSFKNFATQDARLQGVSESIHDVQWSKFRKLEIVSGSSPTLLLTFYVRGCVCTPAMMPLV